ncbi:hypothetical protein LAZ67_15001353 [Cordylochernes scorpioides]|uniref:Transposase Tc1-like domain-containing protein n=1 Tax=Cordylochernes scorpioides TaxID=51811 RepID=A0ABY6LBA7_9ARAC|nr:hypothetical protein LAZ67_15001353 [Cordylochernes scorpioides]
MPGHRKRRQFKQTDAFTRGMVIGLKRAGWSIRQIAADTHLGASTVHRLWRRWLEQGNVAIYRNVGATRVTSARVDRRILRQAVAALQATCTAILQHVQDTLDHSILTRTISRRLVANGLHSCRPLRRLPLTPPNRRQRLEWCRARSTWMTEWHRVVFSDESRFCLSSDSRRVRVWRRRGERSNPAAIVERPTVRQRGIMMLPWPPYSPDLSPIEHVWDIIGRRLHALPQPRSEDELWQMVEREWRAIPQDAIRTLIDSLPRRVAACIAVRGPSRHSTSYPGLSPLTSDRPLRTTIPVALSLTPGPSRDFLPWVTSLTSDHPLKTTIPVAPLSYSRKSKPWFDKDCYDMKKLAKESLKKYRKTNRLEDRECYASSRKKYLALLDLKRKGFDNEKREILRNAKDSKTFWKTIALYKSTSIIQGEIAIQDWLNFYRELMTTEKNLRICNLHNVISQNDPILDTEITNADIYKEIAGLKSNKACGPDGIPNKVLKILPDSYILLLKQLYNSVMTTGKYPAIWTNSTIHPIFKNGFKNSPSNYRGIALISNVSKLFTSILRSRLEEWVEGRRVVPEFCRSKKGI